jgi:hypothetical protein
MRIVEPWDDSPLFQVDPLRRLVRSLEKVFPANSQDPSFGDRNGRNLGMHGIEGTDQPIM